MVSDGLAVLGALACAVAGGVAGAGVMASRRGPHTPASPEASRPTAGSVAAVLEALPLAVLVLDVQEQVLLANRAARDLGLVDGGVLSALPQLRRLVRDTRVTGQPQVSELEAPLHRPGRAPAVYRAQLAPVRDGSVAVLLEDVTQASRLQDVRRDFVANVSHELKTPVGAISLLAEALQDAADDPVAVRRFAGRAHRESQRLAALVQDLVALSRLEGAEPLPEPQPVRLDRVLAEAVDRVRTSAQSRGILLVRSGERGLQVQGIEAQLATAVGNLLENAVNYSPDNARVVVGGRTVQEAGGSAVEVSVTDEGIGIAPRDVERVFERFYRADPARSRATGGTGLGLAIVKHVASNHGGTVSVRSTEGFGSTFTLRLPAATLDIRPTDVHPVRGERA